MGAEKSRLVQLGDRLSDAISRLFAHPATQVAVILLCGAWFFLGYATDLLTAVLSILAITLAQMVLNSQYDREADAHRRDVAMHAKLDELIKATKRARDEFAGIEEDLDEEQIRGLRKEAIELVDTAARQSGEVEDGETAKQAIRRVGDGKVG